MSEHVDRDALLLSTLWPPSALGYGRATCCGFALGAVTSLTLIFAYCQKIKSLTVLTADGGTVTMNAGPWHKGHICGRTIVP